MDRIIVRKLCDFLECSSFDRKVFKIEHNLRYLILTSILHFTSEKENRMLHILGNNTFNDDNRVEKFFKLKK